MAEKPADNTPRGRLRALYDWVTRVAPSPHASPEPADLRLRAAVPTRIGHYAIVRKLGEGGMGVVYAARDERLERAVAVKTMSSLGQDETARKRFWREARAAAAVNHPNVCQIYEIGEEAGELFIAMELLEGEPLADRLRRGALSVADTVPIGLGILTALSALHASGVIHRDLKPSNVFLTAHGVKLLDFGLARPSDPELAATSGSSAAELTRTGMLIGTPRYMAPEQVTGEALDARTDLFAVGAILFEMLAGRPAFAGRNVVEILHATLHEHPPALMGSPAVAGVDRVIRRALAKRPAERPASADAMAEDLRGIRGVLSDVTPALAHALTRLVVLPFRILRPDPETDFLAFSLPDAIATSLAGIGSLVVRSSAVAARFPADAPDLKALATEADVDRVVMGTLLRSGDQLRASAQLVEAPGGTLLTSHTVQSSLGDLFRLQDDIARRVAAEVARPLSGGMPPTPKVPGAGGGLASSVLTPPAAVSSSPSAPSRESAVLARDTPHDARAYEFYLRANELARTYDGLPRARDLYQRCLELDPAFAPAWAHLGRCHRVIGKFIDDTADNYPRAEEAFRRALDLNPRLAVAHKFYAQLESDLGKAPAALVRLLGEANRHRNDPELFAGLVHVCRYCGLFDEAIAAHEEARRLDPNVPTSLQQTLLIKGDIERLLASDPAAVGGGGDEGIRVIGLGLAGRREEARRALLEVGEATMIPTFRLWVEYLLAWIDRRTAEMVSRMSEFDGRGLKIMEDPEAIFQEGWLLCDVGEHARGLEHLRRAIGKGYFVAPTLAGRSQFDALRGDPDFQELLARAEAGRQRALEAFREGGGERLLGR